MSQAQIPHLATRPRPNILVALWFILLSALSFTAPDLLLAVFVERGSFETSTTSYETRHASKSVSQSQTTRSRNLTLMVCMVLTQLSWNCYPQILSFCGCGLKETCVRLTRQGEAMAITLWKVLQSDMGTEVHKGALQDGACPCSPLFHFQFSLLTLLAYSSLTPMTRHINNIKQLPIDMPMRDTITGCAWLLWSWLGEPFSNHDSPPRPSPSEHLLNCKRSNSDKNHLSHSIHNVPSLKAAYCLISPQGF